MKEEKPCCAAAAARKVKRIMVNGQAVGVAQLDEICSKVDAMGLTSDEEIGRALLKEVKIYNYVPAGREEEYRRAVLEEYARRT
ncbi:MAG: hypothetical protein ISF22_03140 [Methanomassiliicoccus sp.]|nr:hypothetical protein [Methanomassiliicoccus sp.]